MKIENLLSCSIFVLTVFQVKSECDAPAAAACSLKIEQDFEGSTPHELCVASEEIIRSIKECAAKVDDCELSVKNIYAEKEAEGLKGLNDLQPLCGEGCEGKNWDFFEGIEAEFEACGEILDLEGVPQEQHCSKLQDGLDCIETLQDGCKAPAIEKPIQGVLLALSPAYLLCDLTFRGLTLKYDAASCDATGEVRILQCFLQLIPIFGEDYESKKLLLGIDHYCKSTGPNSPLQTASECFQKVDKDCPKLELAHTELAPEIVVKELQDITYVCSLECPDRQKYFTTALSCQYEMEAVFKFDDTFDAAVSAKNPGFCTAGEKYVDCVDEALRPCPQLVEAYIDLGGQHKDYAGKERNFIRESLDACGLELSSANRLVWRHAVFVVILCWLFLF